MREDPPKLEAIPPGSGIDAFEALVNKGEWNAKVEEALGRLLEKHPEDLYMLYLNYRESGLVEELPNHERSMYDVLAREFGE